MTNSSQPRTALSAKKIFGYGCGCLLVLVAMVFAAAAYLGIRAAPPPDSSIEATPTPSTPGPLKFSKKYLGLWKSVDNTTIKIRPDGKGDFVSGDFDVSGGAVVIDEKKKILKISSEFNISKTWKIDAPPQIKPDVTTMKLSGKEFRRAP